MGIFDDIRDRLSDAADAGKDLIDDGLDALEDAFDEKADAFWFRIEKRAPEIAFIATSAAEDLSDWFGDAAPRAEKIVGRLWDEAEDAYVDAEGGVRDAVKAFLKSDAVAKAERRLEDLVEQAKSFDLDAYLNDL